MAAQYPDNIYTSRIMVNRPGTTYDETKTKRIYAEDFNKDREEIVAIENELGVNAKGAAASVSDRILAIESIGYGGKSFLLQVSTAEDVGASADNPYILGSNGESVLFLSALDFPTPLFILANETSPTGYYHIINQTDLSTNPRLGFSVISPYTTQEMPLSDFYDLYGFHLPQNIGKLSYGAITPPDSSYVRYWSLFSRDLTYEQRDFSGGVTGREGYVERYTLSEIEYNSLTSANDGVQNADDQHTHGSLLSGITEDVVVLIDYDPATEIKTFSTLHFENGIYIGKD